MTVKLPRFIYMTGITLLMIPGCVPARKVQVGDTIRVEAKQWSKIDGVVHYSDWKPYVAHTIGTLPGFKPESHAIKTHYGSDPDRKFQTRGYFYTIREDNRWWIVDPGGNAFLNAGVSGVRPGSSARNASSLKKKFGREENWITQTHRDLESFGFNGTGSWSDAPLVRYSNRQCSSPLSYTLILNLYSGYQKLAKKNKTLVTSFPVFDSSFAGYADSLARTLTENREDPALLGYFSDNELSFSTGILDEYLAIRDDGNKNYKAAKSWLEQQNRSQADITDADREKFLGVVAERYYQTVSAVLKKYDPNHMYLGSRLHGRPKHNRYIVAAAGKYCDVISINYYGQWEPALKHFTEWKEWADKPILITEFYVKGDDSGLPNISGAGWRVRTQDDRGIFYENFCLKLLQMKNCVGWHWFRYMDNDPTDTTADESNNDSNKGMVDNFYDYYRPLTGHMKTLNDNRYHLVRYFDIGDDKQKLVP